MDKLLVELPTSLVEMGIMAGRPVIRQNFADRFQNSEQKFTLD